MVRHLSGGDIGADMRPTRCGFVYFFPNSRLSTYFSRLPRSYNRSAMQNAIIIVDHGSRRVESNRMLEEVASLFARRYGKTGADGRLAGDRGAGERGAGDRGAGDFSIVEPAHMELCEPSIATAYRRCVERGAGRVVVVPFFLSFGKHWTRDIPSLLQQAAADFPGTSYQLVEPLGIDDLMLDLLYKRASTTDQPVIAAGEADPRVEGLEPTQRREQCTSCPFVRQPDGKIVEKSAATATATTTTV